jgi:carbonic anhydrase/acetyltransferase-like protein (isoleucine patch superfamily)
VVNGAVVGAGAVVAAGAVVFPKVRIPSGRMALGVPARVREGCQVPAGYIDHPVQSYVQRDRRLRAELRRLEA